MGYRLTDDECRAIVEGTVELVVVFDTSGTIRFANEVALDVLGGAAEDYIGRNVVEFAHPDELERALQTLAMSSRFGSIPGATHFRLRRTDGSYAIIELSTGVIDGPEPLRFALGRAADHNVALAYTVHHLAAGMDVAEALRSTLDVFGWRAVDTQVCVLWRASDGTDRWVSTGLPPALTGQGAPPDSMWSEARRTGTAVRSDDLGGLDPTVHAAAVAAGRGGYWIEPVDAPGERALLGVWTCAGGMPPGLHAQGMELARDLVAVVLRWAEQRRLLDLAATRDDLTGLANRRAFFEALDRSGPGAVLYCDLDRFKPVNDRFGHRAGDQVLQEVAERLRNTVGAQGLVARLGGDEFGVICPGADLDEALRVGARIQTAIEQPFAVAGTTTWLGVTIGVAQADHLDDRAVDRADQDLVARKGSSPPRHG